MKNNKENEGQEGEKRRLKLGTSKGKQQAAWSRLEEVRAREHCHTTKFWSAILFRYKITNNYRDAASIIDENCCRIAPEYVVLNDRHDEGDLNTYIRILSSRMRVLYFRISNLRIRNICDTVPVWFSTADRICERKRQYTEDDRRKRNFVRNEEYVTRRTVKLFVRKNEKCTMNHGMSDSKIDVFTFRFRSDLFSSTLILILDKNLRRALT